MPEGMDYGGFVMPYADSPLDGENVGESVYLDILGRSRRYVHITTPYLILDDTTLAALKFAAKRGVEVIIIMPHIPDKLYAYLLARSYYAELLRAGVQIYEYTPGFIHAKMFTSDDEKAVVGTINLDFRSLYLPQCGCDGCGRRFPENTCKERADYSGKLPEVSVYPAVCGEGTADSGAAYVELQNERYGIFMFS